jgi:co-chaperonin GroES (HSP10)
MRVLGDRVLIKQDEPTGMAGTLFVVEKTKSYPNLGTVQAIGPDVKDVQVGDRVYYERKPETSLDPDCNPRNEHYNLLVLPEKNILAVISEG